MVKVINTPRPREINRWLLGWVLRLSQKKKVITPHFSQKNVLNLFNYTAIPVMVVSLADFPCSEDNQLELVEGEQYHRFVEDYGNGWSYGGTLDGSKKGIFPMTFVVPVEME
jgi:hypothetical protein